MGGGPTLSLAALRNKIDCWTKHVKVRRRSRGKILWIHDIRSEPFLPAAAVYQREGGRGDGGPKSPHVCAGAEIERITVSRGKLLKARATKR